MGSKTSKPKASGSQKSNSQASSLRQSNSQASSTQHTIIQASSTEQTRSQRFGTEQRTSADSGFVSPSRIKSEPNCIWYRHSGQPELDYIPDYDSCNFKKFQNLSEILEKLGPHHITHMWVEGRHIPSLQVISPEVTHLRIWRISTVSRLGSLTSLKCLKSLDLSGNNFSMELPRIIGRLSSLEELYLDRCGLSDLPQWMHELNNLKILSLRSNQYADGLPSTIGTLSSLEELNLRECKLTSLPPSLSSLGTLQQVNLSVNNFSGGLPDVIGRITSLEELHLESCKLRELPLSFGKLKYLQYLFLDGNYFENLPPVIRSFKNLLKLSISKNGQLKTLGSGIAPLTNLQELVLSQCSSLTTPPANVIKQGLYAIKQCYKDFEKGAGKNLPAATVCVIGESKSGKTSLIRTLQQNQRILTGSQSRGGDVSTKVFRFEEVEVDGTKLRFIDFGGQEVYHLAYRLTLRANCVPIIVVNMKLYKDLAEKIGDREAVRKLYFNWMAHLYLAHPDLPVPKLVLTHKDQFSNKEFRKMVKRFLENSNDVRDAILLDEQRLNHKEFRQITPLAESASLFESEQIFEIGATYDARTFDTLKRKLLKHCMQNMMSVPRIWEDIEYPIQSLPSGFTLFEDLLSQLYTQHGVDREQLDVVLTYMHYSGKLLWYKDFPPLQQYVFHKISAVTGLLNLLYDHGELSRWQDRLSKFGECKVQSRYLSREKFEQSVDEFQETGIISWVLLAYLIRDESEFTTDEDLVAALALLTYFRLVFGPVSRDAELSYFVPHFATGYLPSSPNVNFDIQLHADLVLKGLPLPLHVYHEMTVGLLDFILVHWTPQLCSIMVQQWR